jgi:hypothetical protein
VVVYFKIAKKCSTSRRETLKILRHNVLIKIVSKIYYHPYMYLWKTFEISVFRKKCSAKLMFYIYKIFDETGGLHLPLHDIISQERYENIVEWVESCGNLLGELDCRSRVDYKYFSMAVISARQSLCIFARAAQSTRGVHIGLDRPSTLSTCGLNSSRHASDIQNSNRRMSRECM